MSYDSESFVIVPPAVTSSDEYLVGLQSFNPVVGW
jgi:hypothetical protein